MMELTKIQQYRMADTKNQTNIKELAGQKIKPIAATAREYTDANAEVHTVLSIMVDSGEIYRTEVKAFIDTFNAYWSVFGDDEDRPQIEISTKNSKRGNPYVNMSVCDA